MCLIVVCPAVLSRMWQSPMPECCMETISLMLIISSESTSGESYSCHGTVKIISFTCSEVWQYNIKGHIYVALSGVFQIAALLQLCEIGVYIYEVIAVVKGHLDRMRPILWCVHFARVCMFELSISVSERPRMDEPPNGRTPEWTSPRRTPYRAITCVMKGAAMDFTRSYCRHRHNWYM